MQQLTHFVKHCAHTKVFNMELGANMFDISHHRCHGLTHLSLCFCEHVTDAGIELLGSMNSLTNLDLSGTNIQDQVTNAFTAVKN